MSHITSSKPAQPKLCASLMGAYGREATFHDWRNGLDFRLAQVIDIETGEILGSSQVYCSIRDTSDMRDAGFVEVMLLTREGNLVCPRLPIDVEIIASEAHCAQHPKHKPLRYTY